MGHVTGQRKRHDTDETERNAGLARRGTSGAPLPLEPAAHPAPEPGFGHTLEHIRVHADERTGGSAAMPNADAYTVGSNVEVAAGEYAPESSTGRELIAHELTHRVQQRSLERNESLADGPEVSDSNGSSESGGEAKPGLPAHGERR